MKLEVAQAAILNDVDKRLSSMVEQMIEEVHKGTITSQIRRLFSDDKTSDGPTKRHVPRNGLLPDKEFIARNSLLTDLMEVKHIKAIYNIHIVAVMIMFLNCFVHDFVDSGR